MKKNTKIIALLLAMTMLTGCSEVNGFFSKAGDFFTSIGGEIADFFTGEGDKTSVEISEDDSVTPSEDDSVAPSEDTSIDYPSIDVSVEYDSRWNVNFSEYGETFRNTLSRLILDKKTATASKSSCLSIGAQAAADPSDPSKFVAFYHDKNTLTTVDGCNREHTWPDSRGGNTCETDPYMLRPTLTKDNSARGNSFYGLGSSEWDPASIEFEAARGESARVIFYVATAYYSRGLSLSNNPGDSTSLKTMGTLKYLIEWNNKYPVTEVEKRINDNLDKMGFGRNPFVDHPEYANYIWNSNGLITSSTDIGKPGDTVPTTEYTLIDSLNDIDKASAYIVTPDGNTTSYYGLTNIEKSETLPWYLCGVPVDLSTDKGKMSTSSEQIARYNFTKQSDGTYTISNGSKYLFHYVDGTHYSIGLGASATNGGNIYWNISEDSSQGFYFSGLTDGVYLEYYKGSFCGYQYKPSVPLYLYH